MVEKIIVSPESIRALGNIVMPKTGADFEEYNCTMEVSEDTVNGEDVTVYVLTPETTVISLVLSSNVSTVTAGGDVILSVTVTEDEVPVSGQSVSFKLGGTELGTSTTNSSGVATYTYTTTGSGSLNFSADYAGHSSNAVSVVVNKRSTSTSLSLSSASIIVGGSTSASATVTSTGSGVSGLTVTFYDGTTSLGTATTNSSGVATYTLSGLAVGSHSITAVVTATDTYDTSTSSASTLTVLDHSYSLAFSAASYVATGGSATLECTLLDNNVPVEGATISVSGSDSSLYTGITNTDGVAQVTVTGVNGTYTFTASYSNVSAQCTVTAGSQVLFYDPCNTTYISSNYGTPIGVSSSPQTDYTSYDSTENAYWVRANKDWGLLPIPSLTGLDNYKISAYFKPKGRNSHLYRGGFGFLTENTTSPFITWRIDGNGYYVYTPKVGSSEPNTNLATNLNLSVYHKIELIKQGNTYTARIYDTDDSTVLGTNTITYSLQDDIMVGLYLCCGSSYGCYVKEIKAESL